MDIIFSNMQDISAYLRQILEIGIITVLIYNVLYFLRGTRAASMLAGIIIILIVLTTASDWMKFEVISWLLYNLWTMLAIALIVIFQPELRRAFAQLGSATFHHKTKKKEAISEVVNAVIGLSKQKIGAIIVFERQIGMAFIVNNAIPIDAKLNSPLIESIFNPYSPLHDGAIIIKNEKIIAAHAILPLPNDDEELALKLGTRHRAAIGITEETDAVAVVVSEKTGIISIACGGRIKRNIESDKLYRYLNGLLISNENFLTNILGQTADDDEVLESFEESEMKNDQQ